MLVLKQKTIVILHVATIGITDFIYITRFKHRFFKLNFRRQIVKLVQLEVIFTLLLFLSHIFPLLHGVPLLSGLKWVYSQEQLKLV